MARYTIQHLSLKCTLFIPCRLAKFHADRKRQNTLSSRASVSGVADNLPSIRTFRGIMAVRFFRLRQSGNFMAAGSGENQNTSGSVGDCHGFAAPLVFVLAALRGSPARCASMPFTGHLNLFVIIIYLFFLHEFIMTHCCRIFQIFLITFIS